MRRHPPVQLDPAVRADLRERVLGFMRDFPGPRLITTTGLDGKPRTRMMGAKNSDDFTLYLLSVKPSIKQQEIEADAEARVVFLQYDAADQYSDQPIRFVEVRGQAELVFDVPSIRAFPDYNRMPDGHIAELDDATIDKGRFGIVVRPQLVRVEGFVPGPRYPIYFHEG